jgi:hypothetical protein
VRFVCRITLYVSSSSSVKLLLLYTLIIMSSKPARARKAANRVPTSLAIPTLPLIETAVPIDPQLLALADKTLANDESDVLPNDESITDEED